MNDLNQASDFAVSSNISFVCMTSAAVAQKDNAMMEPIDFEDGEISQTHDHLYKASVAWGRSCRVGSCIDRPLQTPKCLFPSTVMRWRHGGRRSDAAGKDLTGESLLTEYWTRQDGFLSAATGQY